jgi:hypothetical protein
MGSSLARRLAFERHNVAFRPPKDMQRGGGEEQRFEILDELRAMNRRLVDPEAP